MKTEKIRVLYQTMSPLTHMMGTAGNEALINREPVMTEMGIRYVPILSGNSMRHTILREAGTNALMRIIGLEKFNNIDCANFFFTGGNLIESSATESIEKIKQIYEKLPLIKLIGGSLRNQIITGMAMVGRGTLICEENRDKLIDILSEEFKSAIPDRIMSAEVFIGSYQYTRGDVAKSDKGAKHVEDIKQKDKSNLMIYNGQDVISGAYFINEFILQDVNEYDLGAFFSALRYWEENDATLGGYGRIGHGKVKIDRFDISDSLVDSYIDKYSDYMRGQSDIIDFINSLFPDKDEKKK